MEPEKPMPHPDAAPAAQDQGPEAGRDRLEIIRFRSADARRQAIGALLEYGMLNFTSYSDEEWLVRTPVARKLRQLGVPFQWLTERA
jgi:hypothetical protein